MENYQLTEKFKTIAYWGKFLGYIMIVFGVISALCGLLSFFVGAIPGVIMVFLGLYLLRSGKQAEKLQYQLEERALFELIDNYAKFLKLQGIYMIVSIVLVFVVLALVFLFFGGETGLFNEAYFG